MAKKIIFVLFFFSLLLSGQDNFQLDSLIHRVGELSKSDPDKALELTEEGLTISKQLQLYDKTAELNHYAGMLYIRKGDYNKALEHFSEILKAGEKTKNSKFIARASINIANIYTTQGKYNSALDHYLAALKINEESKDKNLLYVNYMCLGITYYYLKDYKKSLEFYERCLTMDKEEGNPAKMAYSLNTMGVIYKEMGNYPAALEYLTQTRKLAMESRDSTILSHNCTSLGELYGLMGDFEKAKDLLKSGLTIQQRASDNKGIGESLVQLGKLYLKFDQPNDAIGFYSQALELGEKIGINEIKKDANKGLSEAYSKLGDYKTALAYHKNYSETKDSLFNSTSSLQIADMQTKYESEKKEKENVLLLKENDIKALEIGKQKSQRNIMVIALIVLIIIGGLLYNRNRLKHRNKMLQEKELRTMAVFQAQEQEKVHLSKELHDGLGPLLSLIKLNVSSIKTEPGHEKIISEVKELTNQSIKEVRNISHALAPSLLQKQGLQAALREFVNQVNASATLKTHLEYKVAKALSPEMEINLFRIAQEAINNSIKHSGGSQADIMLTEKNGRLEFVIRDNGKGFTQEKNETMAGNGLNNIYSRVNFLKGEVAVNSGAGVGTEYFISIPLSEKHYA